MTVTFTNDDASDDPQRDWLPIFLDLIAIGGWIAVALVALPSR